MQASNDIRKKYEIYLRLERGLSPNSIEAYLADLDKLLSFGVDEGKSYKEIAEIFNMSPKTIDYRIQQALKLLRKELGDYLPAVALVVAMSYLESPQPQSVRHEHQRSACILSDYAATL